MKIAVPLSQGQLSGHFGDSPQVALFEVDPAAKTIVARQDLPTPPHRPGVLPTWLHQQGAQVVIAGMMGQRALAIFAHHGIQVVAGAAPQCPEEAVRAWLEGRLVTSPQACHHDHHGHGHHQHGHGHGSCDQTGSD